MTWALATLLAGAGLAALALSQAKHHATAFGRPPAPGRRLALRLAGWPLLAAALGACVSGFGWGYGLVALAAVVNAVGLGLALLLAYPAAWTRWTRRPMRGPMRGA